MSNFKVGDLVSSASFLDSLYKIIGVDATGSRYYIETIFDWEGRCVIQKVPGLYLLRMNSQVPTFETMIKYEKLKKALGRA